ncbi:IS630 family transposase [Kibdelosporangium aridum]|uniref:IS630 family transposase n=1 Tax=Kibdelosporangium aridum TaxID=2030 RepID=A0A428Z6D2_KIBAR|nr:IS630 family transposase [Kibdelosporangium aridum]RSM82757.1 IS630 family transposase [Kibdelosporangium aridum]
MGRRAEVFVRSLEPEEAQRLVKVTRSTRDRVRLRRAGIVLASMQGRGAADIAVMFAATDSYVREVIHAFNESGFAALDPKWSGGRPRKFGLAARELICRIAQADPTGLGQPFTTWSLTKLVAYLAEHHWLPVSTETIRQILRAAGITWQRTKTWKASQDPDFAVKMDRILALYDDPPADGRVVCVDEFGPLNLLPRPGRGWFPRGHPARQRATYTRTAGVRQMFAALDLATGQMFYRLRDRKRWQEFLEFCKQLRRRLPSGRLYLICDNYGSHHKAEVTAWCAGHDIELVFTPSNASWLNWIECEFTARRYFTLDGSDYPSHTAQKAAIARYIRWANKHATPKRHFAANSKIRRPDYLPNVA